MSTEPFQDVYEKFPADVRSLANRLAVDEYRYSDAFQKAVTSGSALRKWWALWMDKKRASFFEQIKKRYPDRYSDEEIIRLNSWAMWMNR